MVHDLTRDLHWTFLRHDLRLSYRDELVGFDSCFHHQFRVSQNFVFATGCVWDYHADKLLNSWFLPIGFIQAITNVQLGLNVFTEFLIGYMQPGKPNAMMLFKTYGYITMTQGLAFTQDMKLGQLIRAWRCSTVHLMLTEIAQVITSKFHQRPCSLAS